MSTLSRIGLALEGR